jgi:hypothetical protein
VGPDSDSAGSSLAVVASTSAPGMSGSGRRAGTAVGRACCACALFSASAAFTYWLSAPHAAANRLVAAGQVLPAPPDAGAAAAISSGDELLLLLPVPRSRITVAVGDLELDGLVLACFLVLRAREGGRIDFGCLARVFGPSCFIGVGRGRASKCDCVKRAARRVVGTTAHDEHVKGVVGAVHS